MKKVLIIACSFPPNTAIGSQRPYRLAKYFHQYNWEPIVLTSSFSGKRPEGIRIIETESFNILSNIKLRLGLNPEKGLHEHMGIPEPKINKPTGWKSKIIKIMKDAIAYPDINRMWYKPAIESASNLLMNEKIDAIISTSSPVTAHLIARKLKQEFNIPWISDLRDLWTQNHFYNKCGLIKYFEKKLELKTLSDADALVTVTPKFSDMLSNMHKDKKIFCITNGYDTDDFPNLPIKLTSKFTITYTGTLYNGKRDPSLLFEVLEQLIDEKRINKDLIEVRFYSNDKNWLLSKVKQTKLNGVIKIYDFLPRDEVMQKQRESQLLLLLLDNNNAEEVVYPAKIFEYFGARRPIIALGGNKGGIVKVLLDDTNTGIFVENFKNLKHQLLEYYKEFVEFGEVKCRSNNSIKNYTYNSIAKKYSEILNGLILK